MEECETLDPEMNELQEFSETVSQDDEDEVEELQNSLREAVQDHSVKPKFQCLMVDPSFSMVTVQSEDSGIVWETASSRCSTPWASETSSISEAYSMEGSGAAGKITIVFDEEKVVRRRTRSGGRLSRFSDRLSRPGSSRSASALGVERPEMAEVSLPNIKEEKKETEPDLEEIKNKDQQLFSLISEGYEILNIRVPSKLPTVDEEESTELQDNLSYLNETPKIKSRSHHERTQEKNHVQTGEEEEVAPDSQEHLKPDTEPLDTPTQTEGSGDIDYFEKFTLLDVAAPGEQVTDLQKEEVQQLGVQPQAEEQKPAEEKLTVSPSASEESFVFVTDADIVGDHLDEVFYGEGAPADALQRKNDEEANGGTRMRMRRESSVKESGSVLFGTEETTLTPIYFSSGPPKIIDPILLEEPTAMSFMYSDLYEDAVGQRVRSDEEFSEAESVASEKSYKRRFSDSDDTDGYLEKFTLKDETPAEEIKPGSVDDRKERRMMWSQSRFEMTGCLSRTVREEEEKKETAELDTTEIGAVETIGEVKQKKGETKEKSTEQSDLKAETVDYHHVRDQTDPPCSTHESFSVIHGVGKNLQRAEKTEKDQKTAINEEKPPCQTPEVAEKDTEVFIKAADETSVETSVHSEVMGIKTTEQKEIPDQGWSERADTGFKNEVPVATRPSEAKAEEEVVASLDSPAVVQTSPESLDCEQREPAEAFHVDDATVEIVTDCDFVLQALVEVKDKTVNAKETQTQVQIDLQEVKSDEIPDTETTQTLKESLRVDTVGVEQPLVAAHESSRAATEPAMLEKTKTDTDEECQGIPEVSHLKTEELVTSTDSQITTEVKATTPTLDSAAAAAPDSVNEGGELILFVPRGQAVEMDIEVGLDSEKTTNDLEVVPQPLPVDTAVQAEETKRETQLKIEPLPAVEVEESVQNDLEKDYVQPPSPALLQERNTEEEEETMEDLGEDVGVFSPLRSFTPQEDLSGLHKLCEVSEDEVVEPPVEINKEVDATDTVINEPDEGPGIDRTREDVLSTDADVEQKIINKEDVTEAAVLAGNDLNRGSVLSEDTDVEQTMEIHKSEDVGGQVIIQADLSPDINLKTEDVVSEDAGVEMKVEKNEAGDSTLASITKQDEGLDIDLHRVDVGQKSEQDDVAAVTPGEELEYEVISEQDAEKIPESEPQRDTEDRGAMMGLEIEKNEFPPEEEPIEADYDIIDAEEETQARLAAELQGMDWFCLTCGCLLSEDDYGSSEHHSHQVTTVDKAYEEVKEKLSDWISELQGRSENIEDVVSELELAYNTVEEQFVESEAAIQTQNEEMMTLVMEQYNKMSVSLEEEKKSKLGRLYDQIVSFQESIDTTKATLETTAREAETDARLPGDIHESLKAALDSAMSLELGPKGLLVFEDYVKSNSSSSHQAQRKGIPAPQSPSLQPQEPGSATSTSVTVYWKVNPDDIIDCFQVYCLEDPQGAVSEEYRVTVKESYCVLEELEPDKTYKVWVMAVNYTGCSLPSDRLGFTTAPSVPVINTEHCTVMWKSATLRWKNQSPGVSYTLEYCRQCELEGEGLRSISGIKHCEQKVLLQPNENYLFYIKAVNEAGASEQSEAALVSTKGTRFHLLKSSVHPALELSADHKTIHFSQATYKIMPVTENWCPSVLGELLPAQGCYYWETNVSQSTAYRLGVAYSATSRESSLGENSSSWCLQCVTTPTGCRYQFLHMEVLSTVLVIETPERVGTLLDYQRGRLSFYNAQSGQLLGSFSQRFSRSCHPALALEFPGSLELCVVQERPEFTKDS